MQDDYLEPAPIDISSSGFTIQPYHSPTSQNIFGNNAILSTYPLSSHERHLLMLDTSGYPPILPKPPVHQEAASRPPVDRRAESSEIVPLPDYIDEEGTVPEVEYVNPQCVMYTYYTGDVNSVVDEHFKRSLSRPSSFSSEPAIRREDEEEGHEGEDGGSSDLKQGQDGDDSGIEANESPVQSSSDREKTNDKCQDDDETRLMCRRKFPPSFWNSNYWRDVKPTSVTPQDANGVTYLNEYNVGIGYFHSPLNSVSTPYRNTDTLMSAADPYPAYRPRLPGNAWHYPYASPNHTQSAFTNHTPGLELSYGYAPESPFNPMYSSLLIQPSVRSTLLPALPGQMEFPRPPAASEAWSPVCGSGLQGFQQYFSDLPTYDIDSAPAIDSGDPSKDLLWF